MNERTTRIVRSIDTAAPVLLALAMTAYCLVFALRTTAGVQWPYEWDAFRDIGAAQTMLDGRYPEDPILLGKTLWYNPLTAVCNAVFSAATGVPLPRANVLLGPWLQLLTPAGFFVLAWVLFGRWTAVLALAAFLFGKTGGVSAANCATYSPWLLALVFAQGFFYFTLAGFILVRRRRPAGIAWHALVGLLLGLTFMTHTAPAINAGGIMAVITAAGAWGAARRGGLRAAWREAAGPFLALLTVAFAVSLPYTWSILRDYHFHVRNPWPGLYALSYVELAQLPDRLREALNWKNLLAVVGAGAVLARADWRRASLAPFAWLALAALFLAQNYASQALLRRGVVMTALVPGHHAAVYLSAVRWVFFGAGAAALGQLAAGLLLRAAGGRGGAAGEGGGAILIKGACCAVVLAAVVAALFAQRPYRDWPEMAITRDRAGYAAAHESKAAMYAWILKHTRPDAVFLTEDDPVGLQVVMPAARKLAGAMLLYLNPYVDAGPLLDDQRKMLQAMRDGDAGQFYECAARRGVTHFLGREKGSDGAPAAAPRFFREVYRSDGLVACELEPAPAGG